MVSATRQTYRRRPAVRGANRRPLRDPPATIGGRVSVRRLARSCQRRYLRPGICGGGPLLPGDEEVGSGSEGSLDEPGERRKVLKRGHERHNRGDSGRGHERGDGLRVPALAVVVQRALMGTVEVWNDYTTAA